MQTPSELHRTIITGLDIPFWDLVWLLFKLALASVPAAVLMFFVVSLAYMVLLLMK